MTRGVGGGGRKREAIHLHRRQSLHYITGLRTYYIWGLHTKHLDGPLLVSEGKKQPGYVVSVALQALAMSLLSLSTSLYVYLCMCPYISLQISLSPLLLIYFCDEVARREYVAQHSTCLWPTSKNACWSMLAYLLGHVGVVP
jgi:hypothetical protein